MRFQSRKRLKSMKLGIISGPFGYLKIVNAFGQATNAFYEALIQFFRQRDRKDRVIMIQKLQQTIQLASQEVANKLELLVPDTLAD